MSDYRHGSHSVFSIHLHLVWARKYRYRILEGEVSQRVKALILEICRQQDVEILKGYIFKDHLHLLVSIPPQVTISRLVQRLKGRTSYALLQEFAHPKKKYWGRHVWARGYFCCSSGNVTDDVIKAYIENQTHEQNDNFRIEE